MDLSNVTEERGETLPGEEFVVIIVIIIISPTGSF